MANDLLLKIVVSAKDAASDALKSVAGAVASIGTTALKVGASIAGIGSALTSFLGIKMFGDAVTAAADLEEQMGGLQATIDATGGAAGVTADQILEMSRRIGDPTEIRNAAKELLTFKSVAGDTFERTLTLAKDLASAGFGSIESATVMLAKALEDPTKGLSALGEAGVTFTAGQKALITQMMLVGDQAKAQGVILDAVAGQVQGVASGLDVGFNGALTNVREALQRLSEDLGKGALPAITAVTSKIAELYQRAAESGVVTKFGAAIGVAFQQGADAAIKFINEIDFAALQTRIENFVSTTGATLTAWAKTLQSWSTTASAAITAVSVAWNAARGGFDTIAAGILKGIVAVETALLKLRETGAKYGIIPQSVVDDTRANVDYLTGMMNELKSDALNAYDKMGKGIDSLKGPQEALNNSTRDLADEANRLPKGFADAALSLLGLTEAQVKAKALLDGLNVSLEISRQKYAAFFSAGDTQGMAESLVEIKALEAQIKSLGTTSKTSSADIAGAFATLKISSQATLAAVATQAKSAFDIIKSSGTATAVDIQNAFIAYSTAAIAANNGVATSAITTQAAMLGLTVQTSDTGDAVIALKAKVVDQTAALKSGNDEFWANVAAQKEVAAQAAETASALKAEAEWFGKMKDVTRSWSEIMQTAGVDISALGDYASVAEEKFKAVYNALFTTAGALDSMSFEGYASKLKAIGEAAATAAEKEAYLAKSADEMSATLTGLTSDYNDGTLGLSDYITKLEYLSGQYARLSDDDISALTDALDSAKESQKNLTDTAKDGLDSWKEKLYGIYDQEVEIQKLQWQSDLLDAQTALIEARKNGNAEEIAALEEKIGLINTYYEAKVAEAALNDAQSAIDKADAASTEAARIAGLSAEERQYEDTINSLKAQLAAAITANDEILKQSIIDQIEAEKARHEAAMKNAETETTAKKSASDATTASTKASTADTTAAAAAASSTKASSSTAAGTAASYVTNINIDGVLDVNDRTTLDTLSRKLKPYLTNLERTGA